MDWKVIGMRARRSSAARTCRPAHRIAREEIFAPLAVLFDQFRRSKRVH